MESASENDVVRAIVAVVSSWHDCMMRVFCPGYRGGSGAQLRAALHTLNSLYASRQSTVVGNDASEDNETATTCSAAGTEKVEELRQKLASGLEKAKDAASKAHAQKVCTVCSVFDSAVLSVRRTAAAIREAAEDRDRAIADGGKQLLPDEAEQRRRQAELQMSHDAIVRDVQQFFRGLSRFVRCDALRQLTDEVEVTVTMARSMDNPAVTVSCMQQRVRLLRNALRAIRDNNSELLRKGAGKGCEGLDSVRIALRAVDKDAGREREREQGAVNKRERGDAADAAVIAAANDMANADEILRMLPGLDRRLDAFHHRIVETAKQQEIVEAQHCQMSGSCNKCHDAYLCQLVQRVSHSFNKGLEAAVAQYDRETSTLVGGIAQYMDQFADDVNAIVGEIHNGVATDKYDIDTIPAVNAILAKDRRSRTATKAALFEKEAPVWNVAKDTLQLGNVLQHVQ